MSNKKLVILGIIVVVMVILAVGQSKLTNKPVTRGDVQAELIQGLNPDNINKIVVNRGQISATLMRSGKGFVVSDLGNYPADPEAINSVITMCLDIRTSQLYTDNPENFGDLWLTENEARNVIKFYKDDPNLLTGVVIGKAKDKDQSAFVRLISEDKAYVTHSQLDLKSRPIDFVDKNLVSVNAEDITSVTVLWPAGQYVLTAEDDKVVLQDVRPGKKAKDTECESVFDALTSLQFENVKPMADAGNDLVFDRQYICRINDGTVYKIDIAKKEDQIFVKCISEFTGSDKVTITKDESAEELKKKEATLLSSDKSKEFTAKHKNWVYQIPHYAAMKLMTELSELTEDLPEPEPVTDANQP